MQIPAYSRVFLGREEGDNQDIAVWLDKEALTERGWMLDGTPASQVKWLPSAISIRFSTQG